ncbi:MAG: diacylglycerol kinase family protein [Gemmatimonadota bacterium]
MNTVSSPETLIIQNPQAGADRANREVQEWADARPEVELRATAGKGDAHQWARDAARRGVKLVVAAGGDGTVREVGNGLLDADGPGGVALGIVPLGTGNDLARSLGVPGSVGQALNLLEGGRVRRMDVARVGLGHGKPSYFLNALTGGFSGALHDALEPETKAAWGPLSYLRSGVESWGDRTTYRLRLAVDGRDFTYTALNLVVANGATAGGGIPIAPEASLFDGELDVAVVLEATAMELGNIAAQILAGGPGDHEALVRLRGRSIRVSCSIPFPLSIDGEAEEATEISMDVVRGKLLAVVGS